MVCLPKIRSPKEHHCRRKPCTDECETARGHNNDVKLGSMAAQITSFTSVYSAVYWGADQRNHQSSASLAFRWIPAQMASNAENVSNWWRHHGAHLKGPEEQSQDEERSALGTLITVDRPTPQIPQCIRWISHNATFCNRNVHISVTNWCIVVNGTAALWNLWIRSIRLFNLLLSSRRSRV